MNSIHTAAALRGTYEKTRATYVESRERLLDAMSVRAPESTLAQLAAASSAAFNASEEAKRACFGQRAMVLS